MAGMRSGLRWSRLILSVDGGLLKCLRLCAGNGGDVEAAVRCGVCGLTVRRYAAFDFGGLGYAFCIVVGKSDQGFRGPGIADG